METSHTHSVLSRFFSKLRDLAFNLGEMLMSKLSQCNYLGVIIPDLNPDVKCYRFRIFCSTM